VAIAELAKAARDKLTFVSSDRIASLEDWVEQLIAESTGKDGTGILPVVGEPLGAPDAYGQDRAFVYQRLAGDSSHDEAVAALRGAGHPVITIELADPADMGRLYFLWELATAVAGARLGVNPFDQPNVESAKVQARTMLEAYRQSGTLPAERAALEAEGTRVFGRVDADGPAAALAAFLATAPKDGYVALQAYVKPSEEVSAALRRLRVRVRERYGLATTAGYGPRFLHSTGQLHKGDAGKGAFVQFTADAAADAPIPDEPGAETSEVSFGVLEAAQALGDRRALEEKKRRVVRFHFRGDPARAIASLARGTT
jgi:hypothetical protein